MNICQSKRSLFNSAVAGVAICTAASAYAAPVVVFNETLQNGWTLPGAPASELSTERAHTGTTSVLSTNVPSFSQLIFDRSSVLNIGGNNLLDSYVYFDTSAGPLTEIFQVVFYFPDDNNPATEDAFRLRPNNTTIFINGVQDTEGSLTFAGNAWQHLQVDISSNAPLAARIAGEGGVARFDFQYHDESTTPQASVKLFADDVQFTAVPEPGSALLLGLFGVIAATRPRRTSSTRA
jgi:hypothetical protein